MWNASDEALLAGFATGDADAALAFVRRFQARVYGLAFSITNDPKEAEQVAQDAFVRAWRYADSFDPRRGSVIAWMLGITRNMAYDQYRLGKNRRDRMQPEPPTGPFFEHVRSDDAGPHEWAEHHDQLHRVTLAIEALPEEQRQALLAVTLGGHTTQEHAEQAGIPLGTAKTRIRLGLRKLRQALEVHAE